MVYVIAILGGFCLFVFFVELNMKKAYKRTMDKSVKVLTQAKAMRKFTK